MVVRAVLVGFVTFHTRRDGDTTVYSIAVAKKAKRTGYGKLLLNSVPHPIQLKVTEDNAAALSFYKQQGMQQVGEEHRKKRRLLRFYKRYKYIIVHGCDAKMPAAIAATPFVYGVRSDHPYYDFPFFIDAHWTGFDEESYLETLQKASPYMVTLPDIETPDHLKRTFSLYEKVVQLGIERVFVCVKMAGLYKDLPHDLGIAISVPSRYAGYIPPDIEEYKKFKLHLLGGSPHQWLGNPRGRKWQGDNGIPTEGLLKRFARLGLSVESVDGNAVEKAGQFGKRYIHGFWEYTNAEKYENIQKSLTTIVKVAETL